MNVIAWFCYNSFLARSSHSYYSRGKFEIEYENSIEDSEKKKTHKNWTKSSSAKWKMPWRQYYIIIISLLE